MNKKSNFDKCMNELKVINSRLDELLEVSRDINNSLRYIPILFALGMMFVVVIN